MSKVIKDFVNTKLNELEESFMWDKGRVGHECYEFADKDDNLIYTTSYKTFKKQNKTHIVKISIEKNENLFCTYNNLNLIVAYIYQFAREKFNSFLYLKIINVNLENLELGGKIHDLWFSGRVKLINPILKPGFENIRNIVFSESDFDLISFFIKLEFKKCHFTIFKIYLSQENLNFLESFNRKVELFSCKFDKNVIIPKNIKVSLPSYIESETIEEIPDDLDLF